MGVLSLNDLAVMVWFKEHQNHIYWLLDVIRLQWSIFSISCDPKSSNQMTKIYIIAISNWIRSAEGSESHHLLFMSASSDQINIYELVPLVSNLSRLNMNDYLQIFVGFVKINVCYGLWMQFQKFWNTYNLPNCIPLYSEFTTMSSILPLCNNEMHKLSWKWSI